jgi:uncharacterized protein (DUF1800 family)
MGLLTPYSGPWDRDAAAHLFRRACFSATPQQIDTAVTDGFTKTLDALFSALPPAPLPKDAKTGLSYTQLGDTYDPQQGGYYLRSLKGWWAEQLVISPLNVREKMVVFWMNHFATEMQVVNFVWYVHRLMDYLRVNSLGNFKDMARQVTLEPAMLRYLNGNTNTKGSPNENYARELQELFTIGKGPERAPGDYTNYTEQDVQAAAKVLTGWRDPRINFAALPSSLDATFNSQQHDTTNKQFSSAYGGRVITGRTGATAGLTELNDLLDMIFAQNATAEYLVKKLYRYFVNSEVTPDVESNVIAPLASQLKQDNWNVGGVIRTLLSSEHFFSSDIRGSMLKNPADFIVGLLREIPTIPKPAFAAATDPANPRTSPWYTYYDNVQVALAAQQMDLGEPPSVAGWEAYYQSPDFYRIWLSTATLPLRNGFTDQIIKGNRGNNGALQTPDYVRQTVDATTAGDAQALVDLLCVRFFAVDLSAEARERLATSVMMEDQPLYDWSPIWTAYASNPTNQTARNEVKKRLDALFIYMFRMAEFQLC